MLKFFEKYGLIAIILIIVLFVTWRHYSKPSDKVNGLLIGEIIGVDLIDKKFNDVPLKIYVAGNFDSIILSAVVGKPGEYFVLRERLSSRKETQCHIKSLQTAITMAQNSNEFIPLYDFSGKMPKFSMTVPAPEQCSSMDIFEEVAIFSVKPSKRNMIYIPIPEKDYEYNQGYLIFTPKQVNTIIEYLIKAEDKSIRMENESFWDKTDIDEKLNKTLGKVE